MKTTINSESLYWASFNRFELRISGECVLDCSHSGPCDSDVAYWVPKVKAQIESDGFANAPTPEKIRIELEEYGAWEECELEDDDANFARLVWIAACNIADDESPDCSEPVSVK